MLASGLCPCRELVDSDPSIGPDDTIDVCAEQCLNALHGCLCRRAEGSINLDVLRRPEAKDRLQVADGVASVTPHELRFRCYGPQPECPLLQLSYRKT